MTVPKDFAPKSPSRRPAVVKKQSAVVGVAGGGGRSRSSSPSAVCMVRVGLGMKRGREGSDLGKGSKDREETGRWGGGKRWRGEREGGRHGRGEE